MSRRDVSVCLSSTAGIIYTRHHGWIFHVGSGDHNSSSYNCVASSLLTGMSPLQPPIVHFKLSAVSQLFSSTSVRSTSLWSCQKLLLITQLASLLNISCGHYLLFGGRWTFSVTFLIYLSFNFPIKTTLLPRSSVEGPSLRSS